MSMSSLPTTPSALASMSLAEVRLAYRPYHAPPTQEADWTSKLELDTVTTLHSTLPRPIKLLVLYGSLRQRYLIHSEVTWSAILILKKN